MPSNDDSVRARLAEIRASAGVPHSQISMEVLYFLPKGFLDSYAELFSKAVKSDGGSNAQGERAAQDGELGKAQVKGPGGAKTNGRRYKKTFVVLDERALELKTRIDKRLRLLAKLIRAELDLSAAEHKRLAEARKAEQCSGCRGFLQDGWRYCPLCGKDKRQPI